MYIKLLLLVTITFLCSCKQTKQESIRQTNIDGSITIQGRVISKTTQAPPIGLTTMNIKNKWTFSKDLSKAYNGKKKIANGENQRVYVDKQGYYSITIDKNDTLVLIPTDFIYQKPKHFTGFTHNQILNIELEETPKALKDFQNKYKNNGYEIFAKHLELINPNKLIKIAGVITDQTTGKPLNQKDINILYQNNTNNSPTFHFTDSLGQFFLQLPQNSQLIIDAFNHRKHLTINRDTIINLKL